MRACGPEVTGRKPYLFDSGVPLGIDFTLSINVHGNADDGIEGHVTHLFAPLVDEFGVDGRSNELEHFNAVLGVDGQGNGFNDFDGVFQGLFVSSDDGNGVDGAFNESLGGAKDLSGCKKETVLVNKGGGDGVKRG